VLAHTARLFWCVCSQSETSSIGKVDATSFGGFKMTISNLYEGKTSSVPEGHALCPHCKGQFDLSVAIPIFCEKTHLADSLIYILCPTCANQFIHADSTQRKAIMDRCLKNVKTVGLENGVLQDWAVTTLLTLEINNRDIVAAKENGIELSKKEYLKVCSEDFDLVTFPGGGPSIIVTSYRSEADNESH
jgi:uncharacterized protein YodC (DUF2158 family)